MPLTDPPEIPLITEPSTFSQRAQDWVVWQADELYPFLTDSAALLGLSASATSTTSNTIGTGSKSFTVQTGKGFIPGMSLSIARTSSPTNRMFCVVDSYDSSTGALVVTSQAFEGSGTYTDWSIAAAFNGVIGTGQIQDLAVTTAKLATPLDFYKHGNCILAKSGANLVLTPRNGNRLIINSTVQTIPAAGVSLAPPATTLTLYWIYAYMNAGVMTLEASTTTHATDATTGIEIKSGDATRTLVGMARTVTNAWVDTASQRFVRSWFNESPVVSNSAFTAVRSTASATFVELNTEIRCEILLWANDTTETDFNGAIQHASGGSLTYSSLGIDGTTAENVLSLFAVAAIAQDVNIYKTASFAFPKIGLSEGYHYFTLLGRSNTGTASWLGSGTTANTSTLHVTAQKG
jgi:hypothetical protein